MAALLKALFFRAVQSKTFWFNAATGAAGFLTFVVTMLGVLPADWGWPAVTLSIVVQLQSFVSMVLRTLPNPGPSPTPTPEPSPVPTVLDTVLAWIRDALADVKLNVVPKAEAKALAVKLLDNAFDAASPEPAKVEAR